MALMMDEALAARTARRNPRRLKDDDTFITTPRGDKVFWSDFNDGWHALMKDTGYARKLVDAEGRFVRGKENREAALAAYEAVVARRRPNPGESWWVAYYRTSPLAKWRRLGYHVTPEQAKTQAEREEEHHAIAKSNDPTRRGERFEYEIRRWDGDAKVIPMTVGATQMRAWFAGAPLGNPSPGGQYDMAVTLPRISPAGRHLMEEILAEHGYKVDGGGTDLQRCVSDIFLDYDRCWTGGTPPRIEAEWERMMGRMPEENPRPGNPFAERAARARTEYERLGGTTARERAMTGAFPLGVGFTRPGAPMRRAEARVEATIDRAVKAGEALKLAESLESQAEAFDAGLIDERGRRIGEAMMARREKRRPAKEAREARIAAARERRAGKEPWQVTKQIYADASGQIAGGGRALVEYDHREAVRDALAEKKPVPAEVLADYPDLAGLTLEELVRQRAEGNPLTEKETAEVRARKEEAYGRFERAPKGTQERGVQAGLAAAYANVEHEFGSGARRNPRPVPAEITVGNLLEAHRFAQTHGGEHHSPSIRDEGVLHNLVGRFYESLLAESGGDPFAVAAGVAHYVVDRHPFWDCNHRTGWSLAAWILDEAGYSVGGIPAADVERMIRGIDQRGVPPEELAEWLRAHASARNWARNPSSLASRSKASMRKGPAAGPRLSTASMKDDDPPGLKSRRSSSNPRPVGEIVVLMKSWLDQVEDNIEKGERVSADRGIAGVYALWLGLRPGEQGRRDVQGVSERLDLLAGRLSRRFGMPNPMPQWERLGDTWVMLYDAGDRGELRLDVKKEVEYAWEAFDPTTGEAMLSGAGETLEEAQAEAVENARIHFAEGMGRAASPNPAAPLSERILPEVKKLIAAVRLGNKKWEEKVRAAIAKVSGKTGVIPAGLTDEEKKDPDLLARRISCAVEISKRPKKERPREPIAVCRASVKASKRAASNPAFDPRSPYLVPITSIFYLCYEGSEIGLCPMNPDEYYEHRFEENRPLFDTRTFRIHGKVRMVPKGSNAGIHDWFMAWTGEIPAREVENTARPRWRIGVVEKLILENGKIVPYGNGALLWTDESMTRLFIMPPGRNGGPGGLRQVASAEEYDSLAKAKGLTAFYFWQPGCAHCDALEPRLPALAGMFTRLHAVNAAKLPALAAREGIQATPRVSVFLDGEKIEVLRDLEKLLDAVEAPKGAATAAAAATA